MVAHAAVDLQKRAQGQSAALPFAVVDFSRQVNAKLTRILLKILLAYIAFWALIFAPGAFAPGAGPLQAFNAFLVGYSLDSFVGLFDQRAAAQTSAMKPQSGASAR